jgi:putative salt-induced outer membrane protein
MFHRRRRNDDPWLAGAVVAVVALGGTSAKADPLPSAVAAVIDAAAATGKAATLKTVVQMVKQAYPASAAEIDAQVVASKAKAEKARQETLAHQSPFGGFSGEGQLGVSNSTGGSKTITITGGAKITKESLHWMNTLTLNATYKRENHEVTDEKYFAGLESRYKLIGTRYYIVGNLSWDRDPFSGYTNRSAAAIGLGAVLVKTRNLSLSLDAGPAVRSIDYIAVPGVPAYTVTNPAARMGAAFSWTIWPGTTLTDTLTGYVGSGDKTITSITALSSRIVGALSARLSFQFDYDSLLPPGYDDVDTETRVTLVFAF